MSTLHSTVAGIPVPDSTLAREATEFVQDVSTQLLFDHSRRVFLRQGARGPPLRARAVRDRQRKRRPRLSRAPRPARGARHDRLGVDRPALMRSASSIVAWWQAAEWRVNWGNPWVMSGWCT